MESNAQAQWNKHISEIDPSNGDCALVDDEVMLWANNRMNELQALIEMSAPHVFASARAAHLTDGFRYRRHPIDELVERIKAVIPDEEEK